MAVMGYTAVVPLADNHATRTSTALCNAHLPLHTSPLYSSPPDLLRTDNKWPDGMTLVPWTAGSSLVWDVTVVDPLAPSYLEELCKASATTANKAAELKCTKYTDIVSRGYEFVPLAFETLGQPSSSTVNFVWKLGAAVRASTGEERSTSFLWQRLSIAIQQHNTASPASIAGSLPTNEVPLDSPPALRDPSPPTRSL